MVITVLQLESYNSLTKYLCSFFPQSIKYSMQWSTVTSQKSNYSFAA